MNRQQRRQKKKSKIPEPRKKSKSEIQALEFLTTSFLWILHDKHGWGKVRLERITEQVNDFFGDYLDRNQLTIVDIANQLEEETGYRVEWREGELS